MKKLSPEEIAELPFFELNAYLKNTVHTGGLKATDKLIQMTNITDDKKILDVGCGIGKTTCYIAKKYKCEVVGIDINKTFIDQAKKLSKKMKLKGNVEFLKVDSIFALPFENETFDIVISESVFSYIKNKEEVLKELNRVTKKNGCIGINEDIILEEMPDELYQKFDRIFYPLFKFEIIKLLTLPQWLNIFKRCGINNVEYSVNKLPSFSPLDGFVEVLYFPFVVKTWLKIIYLSTINAELRKRFLLFADIFDKELKKEYLRYHGFCIFVGKKT